MSTRKSRNTSRAPADIVAAQEILLDYFKQHKFLRVQYGAGVQAMVGQILNDMAGLRASCVARGPNVRQSMEQLLHVLMGELKRTEGEDTGIAPDPEEYAERLAHLLAACEEVIKLITVLLSEDGEPEASIEARIEDCFNASFLRGPKVRKLALKIVARLELGEADCSVEQLAQLKAACEECISWFTWELFAPLRESQSEPDSMSDEEIDKRAAACDALGPKVREFTGDILDLLETEEEAAAEDQYFIAQVEAVLQTAAAKMTADSVQGASHV